MNGLAYVFLRENGAPLPTGCAGHVGWAFMIESSHFLCGATENPSGQPIVPPGQDNGAWVLSFSSEQEVIQKFIGGNYDAYKVMGVRDCTPVAAEAIGVQVPNWGYDAVGNNCLDHVIRVLAAYRVTDLPWDTTHPSPNDWFGILNGAYHDIVPIGSP